MSPQDQKELDAYILRTDVMAMQTGVVTDEMRVKFRNRIVYTSQTPTFVTLQELEARDNFRRDAETDQAQQKLNADHAAFENMSELEREALGARQWVQLKEAQYNQARARRAGPAELQRRELELEQARNMDQNIRERQAALEVQHTNNHALQQLDEFREALAFAEASRGVLSRSSPEYLENESWIDRLKLSTVDNWRENVSSFYQHESQRFKNQAIAKQQAEQAALEAAAVPTREYLTLGADASSAALQAAEAQQRADDVAKGAN